MKNKRILVIDDDQEIWRAYEAVLTPERIDPESAHQKMVSLLPRENGSRTLQDVAFDITFASQGQEGYEAVTASLDNHLPLAIAFIDVRMPPGIDGMDTAAKIRRIDPDIEIVIVTAYSDRSCYEIVQTVGSPDKLLFFRKPFDPEELTQLALSLTEKWNLAQQEKAALAALHASEERFRALVETTSDYVWEVDTAGRFTYCSPVCEAVYGYRPKELLGKNLFDILLPEKDAPLFKKFFTHCARNITGFYGVERRSLRKNGREIYIESSAVPVLSADGNRKTKGFRGVDRDITERKRAEQEKVLLEEQSRQSQKMEALGTLAGGIAHDLNNFLTPILGYAQMARLSIDPDTPIYDQLTLIEKCSVKAAELIQKILTFSRKQLSNPVVLDLNKIVHDLSQILRRTIREDIELIFDLDKDLHLIHADPRQMEQVLINLVVNARDAVEKDGKIIVRTRNEKVTEERLLDFNGHTLEGSYIVLTVEDNGKGINPKTLEHIFDPFYTTKDVGKGTGMGLASVYGVVNQHKGHILVDSTPGKGTSFNVYFKKVQKTSEPATKKQSVWSITGGDETILIAEDHHDVLSVIKSTLEGFGYTVIPASNGNEAIRLFNEYDARIDLLVTDIVMPELNGPALVEILREKQPGLPVVFISGHASAMGISELEDIEDCISFLQKPFKIEALGQKIREILDMYPDKKAGKTE